MNIAIKQSQSDKKGQLIVAGCGLHPGQMTLETKSHIENADKVLLVAPNPLSNQHILGLNACVENLGRFYQSEENRARTYREMARYIVEQVKLGQNICVVFYGHPGVFVTSTHIAMEHLQKDGYSVQMLPGISADACLFADLNFDPAFSGCQSYEATQFLLTKRSWDPGAALIIWQIGLVGEHTLASPKPGRRGLHAMQQLLTEVYPKDHQVCLYEAATIPGFKPRIDWLPLSNLSTLKTEPHSTLFIPPSQSLNFARERLDWLELGEDQTRVWQETSEFA